MQKFDWKTTTKINILMLKIVGLWPREDFYKTNFYTVYAFISIIIIINGHTFFQVMNIFFVYTDLEALTATIFVTNAELLASYKIFCYVKSLRVLKRLMAQLDGELFQPKNQKQEMSVTPDLKIWQTIYYAFWIPGAATLFLWSIFPVLDKSVKEYRLPFSAWYPYDTKVSPFYELTYLYQVIGIWYMGAAVINIDTLMAAIMMYCGAQCDILCDNLKNFTEVENIRSEMVRCINHHKEVIHFADGCNSCLSILLLGQFFSSALTNGITMFQLTLVKPFSSEFFSLLFFVNTITMQIFIYCWFGEEVSVKILQCLSTFCIVDVVI